jgi:hypothetical protein
MGVQNSEKILTERNSFSRSMAEERNQKSNSKTRAHTEWVGVGVNRSENGNDAEQ